jgi:alanyl-tRNA synthetase
LFKLLSEGGVAAGVRRIEAVTGRGALAQVAAQEALIDKAADLLGGRSSDVLDKLRGLLDRQKKLEREIESFKAKAAAGASADLAAQAVMVGGLHVVAARLEGMDAKGLRDAVDALKQKLGDVVVILAAAGDGKASLIAGSHGAALGRVKAGDLLAYVAAQVGGKGGGRPDLAQGGGNDGPELERALAFVPQWVAERLGI